VFIKSLGNASDPTRLTDSRTASLPAWSPDGTKVAYLDKDDSGVKQIFIKLAAESNEHAVAMTSQIAEVDAFAWSPDATMIAFRALVPGADELAAWSPLKFSKTAKPG
jgi:Tol biopolymer transport system component